MAYINWVDVLVVIILARSIFVGKNSGIIIEFFKLISTLFATFIAVHYYANLAKLIKISYFFPEKHRDMEAFVLLILFVTIIFSLIRRGWIIILKVEFHKVFDRWGGILISAVKGWMICGLVILAFLMSNYKFLMKGVYHSASGYWLKDTSVNIYRRGYFHIVHPLFENEEFNKEVLKVIPDKKTQKRIHQDIK